MNQNKSTRRSFIKNTSLTASAIAAGSVLANRTNAAEKLVAVPADAPKVAILGCGIRFYELIKGSVRVTPTVAICDVDTRQSEKALPILSSLQAENGFTGKIDVESDYRKILDRKDIQGVIIGTPDHWHTKMAIEAMAAGKDIYCEKPLTLTIDEGRQIEDALNRYNRVFQVGTQQRSDFGQRFLQAIAIVQAGRIGKLKKITVAIGPAPDSPEMKVTAVPSGLDYEQWTGPAPMFEYLEGPMVDKEGWGAGFPTGRTHRYFRWFYEYSGGKMTDWGAHHVDISMWAARLLGQGKGKFTIKPLAFNHPVPMDDKGMPTDPSRYNVATTFNIQVTFEDGLELIICDDATKELGFENGIMFQGESGRFFVNRGKISGKAVEDLKTNPLPEDAIAKLYGGTAPIANDGGDPIAHMQNWADCIASRKTPVSDVASHNAMMNVLHSTNIAMRLNRAITFDPATLTFVDDEAANAHIRRQSRKGFEIAV
jgi:predicted dehydrogenase